jgi:YEATS domain-containing protein 4
LHAYGSEAEKDAQALAGKVTTSHFDEVVFNEPFEAFYDVLTGGGDHKPSKGKGSKKREKEYERTAELPVRKTTGNPYSVETEGEELDRMKDAIKKIDSLMKKERGTLAEREKYLMELRESEGLPVKKK